MTYPELLARLRAQNFPSRIDLDVEEWLDTKDHVQQSSIGIDVAQRQYLVVGRSCIYMRDAEAVVP